MLHTVAKLAQNILWHIGGVLSDEVHTNAFGPNQTVTCSTLLTNTFGASSKKKTSFGLFGFSTSGSSSNNSERSHNKNVV